MRRLLAVGVFALLVTGLGCSNVDIVDDDIGQQDQALESQSCHDRCMEQFHQCRESGGAGGPGNSGCAHEKNACKDRC